MRIVIDSPLWALGLKVPFLSGHDPILQTAISAQSFLRETLKKNNDLLISSQLAADVFDQLTRKGSRIPSDQAEYILREILLRKRTTYRPISQNIIERALHLSALNDIPVWKYLVALPFEDQLDVIYTNDAQFQHSSFAGLAEIQNPLNVWTD